MKKARIDKDAKVVPMAANTLSDLLAQNSGWHMQLQNSPVAPNEPEKLRWHVEVLPPDPCH